MSPADQLDALAREMRDWCRRDGAGAEQYVSEWAARVAGIAAELSTAEPINYHDRLALIRIRDELRNWRSGLDDAETAMSGINSACQAALSGERALAEAGESAQQDAVAWAVEYEGRLHTAAKSTDYDAMEQEFGEVWADADSSQLVPLYRACRKPHLTTLQAAGWCRSERCPRPINTAGDESAAWCVLSGNCGCDHAYKLCARGQQVAYALRKGGSIIGLRELDWSPDSWELRECEIVPLFDRSIP